MTASFGTGRTGDSVRNWHIVPSIGLLLIAVAVISCARIFPPAELETGPTPTPAPPPPIATHAAPPGETDCLVCHASDPLFIAALERDHPIPYPPGFKGTAREACELCHNMGTAHAATNPIPHPLEGMGECLTCHASGAEGIAQTPADHVGRTDSLCTMCHAAGAPTSATPPAAAMAIPHPVEGREDCLACHKDGMPADHKDRTNATCTTCHASPVVEPSTTPVPGATEPSPTAPAVAMAIPHPVEGREDCLACHKDGMPADHKDRTNATCTMCHAAPLAETPTAVPAKPSPTATAVPAATPTAGAVQPGPSPTPAAMPTPTVAPTAAPTATATAIPAPVVEGPAPIPHALAGMANCQMCHMSGAAAPSQAPASHAEYDASLCIFCHAPPEGTAPLAEQPSDVPHSLAGMGNCQMCHMSGAAAPSQAPDNHTGFDNAACTVCHAVK